ncbi:serine hydrolase domain-containing protein [Nakamurella deserti]|uniref:serine hydrolase domain-containing protein n=1 Tax=Nakamurella deserti TaxID=2164074 RepID=UPI000DBE5232|nr:serine hydrolase domain-containing protein [Nakamurella deserti]
MVTTAEQLSHRLAVEQSDRRLPSVSAAWVRDGEIRWQDAIGTVDARPDGSPATPDTQYRIGSITKTFVAVLVLRLAEEGRLALDDPLDRYLPGTATASVTLRSLLSHAGGIRAETDNPWWERTAGIDEAELRRQLIARDLAVGHFHYSNVGYGALGAVVAALRGRSWLDCVREEILAPLGMSRTTDRPAAPHATGLAVHPFADVVLGEPEHDAVAMAPAGQLWSTTGDLARYATFLQAGDDRVLPAAVLARMKRPHTWDDPPGQRWSRAYGLGLEILNADGRRQYGHGGSMPGFLAMLRFRADGDAILVLTNTTTGLSPTLVGDLLTVVDRSAPRSPTVWHARPDQADRLELTGEWFWGPARLTMHVRPDGWLELVPVGAGRGSRFRRTGADSWEGQDGYYLGETLRVIRPAGTRPYLDLASFRLTRTPYDPDADIPGGVDPAGWS